MILSLVYKHFSSCYSIAFKNDTDQVSSLTELKSGMTHIFCPLKHITVRLSHNTIRWLKRAC